MTTDDFIEAARAEAERRNPSNAPKGLTRASNAISRRDFRDGAEWARTHLAQQNPLTEAIRAVATTTTLTGQGVEGIAKIPQRIAQEPTDAEVEAAARALYAEDVAESYIEWPAYDSPQNVGRELYIERARNALSAARAARRDEENR